MSLVLRGSKIDAREFISTYEKRIEEKSNKKNPMLPPNTGYNSLGRKVVPEKSETKIKTMVAEPGKIRVTTPVSEIAVKNPATGKGVVVPVIRSESVSDYNRNLKSASLLNFENNKIWYIVGAVSLGLILLKKGKKI